MITFPINEYITEMYKEVTQRWKAKGEPVLPLTKRLSLINKEAWEKKTRLVDVSPKRALSYSWYYDTGKQQAFSKDNLGINSLDLERRHCILYLFLDVGLSLEEVSKVYFLIFQDQVDPTVLRKIYLIDMWRQNIPVIPSLDPKDSSCSPRIREAEHRRVLLCDIAGREARCYRWLFSMHKNMIDDPSKWRAKACRHMRRLSGNQRVAIWRTFPARERRTPKN